MDVQDIDIDRLYISELNVRKILVSDDDETGISDLANDIRTNGLINPITVRKIDDKYEIIAGQRRYLAIKLLNMKSISCNIISVSKQKAEEISLVENVQRNPMTNSDKIKTYAKLYNIYNKDIDKVVNAINISRNTLQKYIKISSLPDDIINLLDSSQDNKITIDVALELTKLPNTVDKISIINQMTHMTTSQRISGLKEFIKKSSTDIEDFKNIKENIILKDNDVELVPSSPYVIDNDGNYIKIPKELYNDIIDSIKEKYNIEELIIK